MPSLIETLDSIDTGKLTLHLQAANGTVSVSGSASLAALDPRDMLGDLGMLLKSKNPLAVSPDDLTKSFASAITELASLLHVPAAEAVADTAAVFDRLVKLLEQIAGQVGGDPDALVEKLLGDLGGLEKILTDISTRALDGLQLAIPAEVQTTLNTFRSLVGAPPTDPEHLAGLLTQALIGLDLATLKAPGVHIADFLDRIHRAGGDFGPVNTAMETLAAQVRLTSSLMLAPELDLDAIEAELNKVKGALDVFVNSTLAGAIAKLTNDLAALDPEQIVARLRQLLGPLETKVPGVLFDIEQDLVKPLKQFALMVDALTPDALTLKFQAVVTDVETKMSQLGLNATFDVIDDLFDRIVSEIQRVPMRELRAQLLAALAGVEGKIRQFPGFSLPDVLAKQVADIESAIGKIDLTAIQKKVDEFAAQITSAANRFPIGEIKTEIEGLIASVRQALDQFKPLLEELKKEIDGVVARIGEIDFSQAGQASIDLVHGIRENVQQAIGSGDVPEPVKMAIGAAATALKGIDVKVEVSSKFDAELTKIDPRLALAPIDPILAKIRSILEKVTPGAIIVQLDKPFSALLESLNKLKPAALLAGLSAEFDSFVGLIGKLDPKALVVPIEAQFQKLVKNFLDAVDPAPLFAPLRTAYKKLQGLIDVIDLESLLSKLLGKLTALPDLFQSSMQSTVAKAAPRAGNISPKALREFRFGDIIRPLVALINRLKAMVTGLAETLIGDALALLDAPLALLRKLAGGVGELVNDVAAALEGRRGQLDLFGFSGPAVELRAALEELSLVSATLPMAGKARLGPLVASVQLNVHAPSLAGPLATVDGTSRHLTRRLAPPDLVVALRGFGETLARLVPGPLLATDASMAVADRIAALFDSLNLEPLAQEMDDAGQKIQAKMASMINQVVQGVQNIISAVLNVAEQFLPVGLLNRFHAGMELIRAEVAVLDPAVIEAEVRELVDAVVAVINRYSPTAIAGQFSGIVDALNAKVQALNPATLLGNLDPISKVIADFEALRPSVVLKPLSDSTADLTTALENLIPKDLTDTLVKAADKLKAELSVVVQGVEAELQALLDYLEGLSGGGASVSASVSVG